MFSDLIAPDEREVGDWGDAIARALMAVVAKRPAVVRVLITYDAAPPPIRGGSDDRKPLAVYQARHQAQHRPYENECLCGESYPCDAAIALTALGRAWDRADVAEAEAALYQGLAREESRLLQVATDSAEAQRQATSAVAAWLLSYSADSYIARRDPGIYWDMLWHGYRAACVVLGKQPAGYPAWKNWFSDRVRQDFFDELLARHRDPGHVADDARQAAMAE